MTFYAHSNEGSKTNWQTIRQHLEGAAGYAYVMGDDAGISTLAEVAALLHDLGKYSQAFQRRIQGSSEKVDHATAGAQEAVRLFGKPPLQKILGEILAYCIAGHHGGLPDYGSKIDVDSDSTLQARLKRLVPDYLAYTDDIDPARLTLPDRLPVHLSRGTAGFSLSVLTRMIYSTLVDADFLDTETFMNGGQKPRGGCADIPSLTSQFTRFLTRFENPDGEINRRRTETLQACIARASEPPGLFTLTLPTGGGKTFASMAFALNHAVQHGMKRIIYVIPYTSIIEQNAAVFKGSLGALGDAVLEHHSNFDWSPREKAGVSEDGEPGSALAKLKLAAENWDIPIIVTTSVQFFESFYASRSSRSRKVHNLAKSVILFDEAQMLPRPYLKPCLYAVAELVRNYRASAVFCTATQPCIEPFLPNGAKLTELIPNPQAQFDFYRRVRVVRAGKLSDADLHERLNQHEQALCIVNTRKHARRLYEGLQGEGRYHLSTLMCAAHRS